MYQRSQHLNVLGRICAVALLSIGCALSMAAVSRGWDHVSEALGPYGAQVTYYGDPHFEDPLARNIELRMVRDYRESSPVDPKGDSFFAARWEADLWVTSADLYHFFSESEQGVRLWIDNQLVIDNWHPVNWRGSGMHAQMQLNQGLHRLKLEHYCSTGNGAVRVKWYGGDIPKNTVIAAPFLRKTGVPYF